MTLSVHTFFSQATYLCFAPLSRAGVVSPDLGAAALVE